MPLGGYISDPTSTRPEQDVLAERTPSPRREVEEVLTTGGTTGTLTGLLARQVRRSFNDYMWLHLMAPMPTVLSAQTANERFGIPGALVFTHPVTEVEAGWRQEARRDELYRRQVLERNESVGTLAAFGLSLWGGLIDPASMALNLVPVVGEGRLLANVGLAGRAAAVSRGTAMMSGGLRGAYGGLVGSAVSEGLTFGLAHGAEGRDYTVRDAATGLVAGTILGAGAGGLLHAAGWRPPGGQALSAHGPVPDMIRAEAQRQGVDPGLALAIGHIESRFNPDAANRSGHVGVFQFDTPTWQRLGGGDPSARTDPATNIRLGVQLVRENRIAMQRSLGRAPTNAELYLAHQQGNAGAAALLRNPDQNAVDAIRRFYRSDEIARSAIVGNGGRADMTAGQFVDLWAERYRQASGEASAPAAPVSDTPESDGFDPLPRVVSMLDDEGRAGAFATAVDDLSNDRPISVGRDIDAELASPRARPQLDEEAAEPSLPGRYGQADTAVTVRGTEVPVRYAIVEADHLVTSHDDDLIRNPDYPEDLQPRERERAGSQARLMRMEAEFAPARLMAGVDAESGAPIVSPAGVVESGNGRTIVVRRAAARETPNYERYKAELVKRGYDLEGFNRPVLVRVRTEPMDGATRVRLAREMNADVTERLSVTEQAFEDAKVLTDEDLALYQGGEVNAAGNRPFHRRFVDKAAAGQENAVVDGETQGLTQEGERRIQAAMVARAYGDKSLVYAVFETTDPHVVGIGKAMTAAAPDWARMRAAAGRGDIPAFADTTGELTSAVSLVRHSRENRLDLENLVRNGRDQVELFSDATAISPTTEWYLRLFFRDEANFKTPTGAATIEGALRSLAKASLEVEPRPGLFGDEHAITAEGLVESAIRRAKGQDVETGDLLFGGAAARDTRSPAPADAGESQQRPRQSGGDGASGGIRPEDSPDPGSQGGSPDALSNQGRLDADPELKALQADIEALAAEIEPHAEAGRLSAAEVEAAKADTAPPRDVVEEALRAAAFCLREGGA